MEKNLGQLFGKIHPECKITPILLEILVEIPNFVCIDNKPSGKLATGQIVSIPAMNAYALIHRKFAIKQDLLQKFLKDNFGHMKVPDTKTEMDWRTMTAITQFKTKFKKSQKQAESVWQDYCTLRGWPYQETGRKPEPEPIP